MHQPYLLLSRDSPCLVFYLTVHQRMVYQQPFLMLQASLLELWILCWTPHRKLLRIVFCTTLQIHKYIGQ